MYNSKIIKVSVPIALQRVDAGIGSYNNVTLTNFGV
mgnify:FL=1